MRRGRPLGATACLVLRIMWVFHRCATCCSSSCKIKLIIYKLEYPIVQQYMVVSVRDNVKGEAQEKNYGGVNSALHRERLFGIQTYLNDV